MKIGIMGLLFNSTNLGCSALAYSFAELINRIAKENDEIIECYFIEEAYIKGIIYNHFDRVLLQKKYLDVIKPQIKYSNIKFKVAFYCRFFDKIILFEEVRKCDYVFDFSMGDSFTDIYGQDRFEDQVLIKQAMVDSGIKLILGNQTIGPFNILSNRERAGVVLNKAYCIYVRDEKSFEYVKTITNRTPVLSTDIAFLLPYKKNRGRHDKKFKIGLNISGLLWNNGYTGTNEFGLCVDYKKYTLKLIRKLLEAKDKEIHLIPHVLNDRSNTIDNDFLISAKLQDKYDDLILAPAFKSPIEAKNYIGKMNLFIGARMHSDIAAFSCGIPVIPFSYSRKFEGLFYGLDYPFVIEGRKVTTNHALRLTLEYINKKDALKEKIESGKILVDDRLQIMMNDVRDILTKGVG